MKAWLLALGLTLFCTVRADWKEVGGLLDVQALGRWHMIALASDCEEFNRHTSNLRSSPATVSLTLDRNVRVLTYLSTNEGCKKLDMTFQRREDGKFVHKCEFGMKTVDSMATDYRTYAIIKVHLEKDGHICTILGAFTRERALDSVTAEKFRSLASGENIPESQVTFLPIEGNCEESETPLPLDLPGGLSGNNKLFS